MLTVAYRTTFAACFGSRVIEHERARRSASVGTSLALVTRMLPHRGAFSAATLFALLALPHSSAAYPVFSPATLVAAPSTFTAGDSSDDPKVATNGTDFLVTWRGPGAIECARVTANEVLLDQPSIQLSLTGTNPQAFWDGSKYLVVSSGQAQRVDPATGARDPAFTLQGAATSVGVAAFVGGAILDVWQAADGTLVGGVFDLTGAATSPAVVLASGPVTAPSYPGEAPNWGVAASGGQFVVGWITTGMAVEAARVSTGGVVADAPPLAIVGGSGAGTPPAAASIDVAGSPGQYLVSWLSGAGLQYGYAARILTSGVVADPGGVSLNAYPGDAPHATWDGTEWWIVNGTGGSAAIAQTLGSTGSPSATVDLELSVSAVAANAGARLIATVSQFAIYATGVTPSGAGAYTTGVTVSSYPAAQTLICTAASAAGYFVAWLESSSAFGVRFTLEGTPIDTAPFAFGGGQQARGACGAIGGTYYFGGTDLGAGGDVQSFPTTGALAITKNTVSLAPDAGTATGAGVAPLAMSCLPDRCLLLSLTASDLWATIFGAGGAVIFPPTNVSAGTFGQVALANDGSSFLIFQSPNNVAVQPSVLTLSASGALGASVPDPNLAPSLAAGGGGHFLANAAPGLIWLDESGAELGGGEALPSNATYVGSIVWDGTGFFVGASSTSQAPVGMEIAASAYDPDAGAPAVVTYPLFPEPVHEVDIVLAASDGAGHVMAVTSLPSGSFATPLVFTRFGAPGPSVADAGPDSSGGSDAGDGGSPSEAGAVAGNDASANDAGSIADDASVATGGLDAGAGALDGGGGSADATTNGDGGEAPTASSGCGCTTVGGGLTYPGGWGAGVALALLCARRRRRGGGP